MHAAPGRPTVWLSYNDKGQKRCTRCKRFLDTAEFERNRHSSDGLTPSCRNCKRTQTRNSVPNAFARHRRLAQKIGSLPLSREVYERLVNSPCVFGGGTRKQGIRIGVDRIDSRFGYSSENAQPCCPRHNALKSQIDDEAFALHLAKHPESKKCGNRDDIGRKWKRESKLAEPEPSEPDPTPLPLFDESF
jgi:hypothetical protein